MFHDFHDETDKRVFFWKARTLVEVNLLNTSPLFLPTGAPTRTKSVPNCSSSKFVSIRSQKPEREVLLSYEAKTEMLALSHASPTRHSQLARTATDCFHFVSIPLKFLCWHHPGNLVSMPAPKRVWLLICGHCMETPPFAQFTR